MRIELANLEEGGGKIAHTYESGELDLLDDRVLLSASASISGKIRRSGQQVFVTGHVDAQVQVECDRCLKQVDFPVTADFKVEYITEDDYRSSQVAELTEEAMLLSVFDGKTIDIDEIVREQVLLSVPGRMLCGENCKGICPNCGMDRNRDECKCETGAVDPRWSALKKLANK
jgi:uncharacterized protein